MLEVCGGNLINVVSKDNGARVPFVTVSERPRGNEHEVKYRKFHLNIRQNFFAVRVVKHWNGDVQNLAGCSSKQSALNDFNLSRGVRL